MNLDSVKKITDSNKVGSQEDLQLFQVAFPGMHTDVEFSTWSGPGLTAAAGRGEKRD